VQLKKSTERVTHGEKNVTMFPEVRKHKSHWDVCTWEEAAHPSRGLDGWCNRTARINKGIVIIWRTKKWNWHLGKTLKLNTLRMGEIEKAKGKGQQSTTKQVFD